MKVPFNRPSLVGREFEYLQQVVENRHLSGNGTFTERCQRHLENLIGSQRALLTHSCTSALEMAALLLDLRPGDEVIMPSFTFTSTANAVVLRGATPVFVDVRADTLNIDEAGIEAAITDRTRSIWPVHYAGVACNMNEIVRIARERGLTIVEDAAQALHARWWDRPLGSFGDMAAFSFHETKNIISGEGGALMINDPSLIERAEVIWEKGTNRLRFKRGEVDKYTWVDIGSSFLPGELTAAFLLAQLEKGQAITEQRLRIWNRYHAGFADAEAKGYLRRPTVPAEAVTNGHIYYILLADAQRRDRALEALKLAGVNAITHYVPLHTSPAGRRFGRFEGKLTTTDDISARLIRLPISFGLTVEQVDYAIGAVIDVCERV